MMVNDGLLKEESVDARDKFMFRFICVLHWAGRQEPVVQKKELVID